MYTPTGYNLNLFKLFLLALLHGYILSFTITCCILKGDNLTLPYSPRSYFLGLSFLLQVTLFTVHPNRLQNNPFSPVLANGPILSFTIPYCIPMGDSLTPALLSCLLGPSFLSQPLTVYQRVTA
jgi:hypothetical protein